MLAKRGQDVSVMLDLDVPEDELMVRLIKRGKDSGRADDNEETIKKRLHVYHSQTAPLIDWYKNERNTNTSTVWALWRVSLRISVERWTDCSLL